MGCSLTMVENHSVSDKGYGFGVTGAADHKAENLSLLFCLFIAMIGAIILPATGYALPFNDDMVHDQFGTNEVMRPTPKRSVPLGSLERYIASPQEADALENPISGDVDSVFRGKRLWNVSCAPCHGIYENGSFNRAIPIESGLVYINFEDPSYWDTESSSYRDLSDGFLFRYIHFGGAIMPRYSWKLTITEHWDIVNYINSIWEEKRQDAR